MTSIRKLSLLLVAICAWLSVSDRAAAGQPPVAVAQDCVACHGEGGISPNPMVPILAGQPYTLLEDNLLAFRSGKRTCSPERNDGSPPALLAQTMCATVATLTDQQIAVIAAWFESLPFEPAQQAFEPALAEQGAQLHQQEGCERCHSDGGRISNAMAPILAGQWTPYLRRAMDALQSGTRKGPKVMNAAIHDLQQNEIEALLNYYAENGHGGGEHAQGLNTGSGARRKR